MGKDYGKPTGSWVEEYLVRDIKDITLPSKQIVCYVGKDILSHLCREFHTQIHTFKHGKKRNKTVVKRWIIWAILRERGLTWPMIARMSEKDHSTIMHGVKKYYALCEKYEIKSVRDINAE